jgi:hypothetical protein
MPIDLTCSCGKLLRVADEFAGKQGGCPACGAPLEIPASVDVGPGAGPSPFDAAQAVTAIAGEAGSGAPASTEYAETLLRPEPAEPTHDLPEVRGPLYKLFSPICIGVVALLAGPLAAFLLLALNYWRLGRRAAACISIGVGLLTYAALVAVAVSMPLVWKSYPFLISLPLFLVVWGAAHVLQWDAFEKHQERGGKAASGWAAAGIALLALVLQIGLSLGADELYHFATFGKTIDVGRKIDFGGGEEVYYTKGASEADATALGAFLCETGRFTGQGPKAMQVSRDDNRFILSFIVLESALNDRQVHQDFRAIGQEASLRAFGGRAVKVHLCDEYFNVKKEL